MVCSAWTRNPSQRHRRPASRSLLHLGQSAGQRHRHLRECARGSLAGLSVRRSREPKPDRDLHPLNGFVEYYDKGYVFRGRRMAAQPDPERRRACRTRKWTAGARRPSFTVALRSNAQSRWYPWQRCREWCADPGWSGRTPGRTAPTKFTRAIRQRSRSRRASASRRPSHPRQSCAPATVCIGHRGTPSP